MKYKRKPEIVDAVEWKGTNFDEIKEVISEDATVYNRCLFVGDIMPNNGDMVIKDEQNRIYKMSKSTFNRLYEEVVEND